MKPHLHWGHLKSTGLCALDAKRKKRYISVQNENRVKWHSGALSLKDRLFSHCNISPCHHDKKQFRLREHETTSPPLPFMPGNQFNAHEHPPIEMKAPYGPMGCVLKHHYWVTVSHIICLFFYGKVRLVAVELWSKRKSMSPGLRGDLTLVSLEAREKRLWNQKKPKRHCYFKCTIFIFRSVHHDVKC